MASHLLIYCFAPDFIVNIKTSVGAGMPLNSYGSCYGFSVSDTLVSSFNPHSCYLYDLHPIYPYTLAIRSNNAVSLYL